MLAGNEGKWLAIVILVEGIYSMEGHFCPLKDIVRLKLRYGALLWLDEAHSLGTTGLSGRGATEFLAVERDDVDILMGTLSKGFSSVGGVVAGKKELLDAMRRRMLVDAELGVSVTPVAAQQALSALRVIQTPSGREKIQNLKVNSGRLRDGLVDAGHTVLGDEGSPLLLAMVGAEDRCVSVTRECMKRGLVVVPSTWPVVAIGSARIRFCVSAAHTVDDIDFALSVYAQVTQSSTQTITLPTPEIGSALIDLDVIKPLEPVPSHADSAVSVCAEDTLTKRPTDFRCLDPLGLLSAPPSFVIDCASRALARYGCGSNGSRVFLGTSVEHLALEERIAQFLGTEASIVYSGWVVAASSAVGSLVDSTDTVFCHSATGQNVRDGLRIASHDAGRLHLWRTNQELMGLVSDVDSELRSMHCTTTVWIILQTGVAGVPADLSLREIAAIKSSFSAGRIGFILDDSWCFGVHGPSGRGSLEAAGLDTTVTDCLIGSLEHALGSQGGFAASRKGVCNLLLMGGGYGFTAAPPVFLAVAARKSLDFLDSHAGRARLASVQRNLRTLHRELERCEAVEVATPGTSFAAVCYVSHWPNTAPIGVLVETEHGGDGLRAKLTIRVSSQHSEEEIAALIEKITKPDEGQLKSNRDSCPFGRVVLAGVTGGAACIAFAALSSLMQLEAL